MKIVPKLTLLLFAGSCVILAANGYVRVRREIAFFEANRVSDHEMIGRSVVAAAGAVWKSEGRASALATIDAVNSRFSRVQVRWLEPSEHGSGPVGPEALSAAPNGVPMTRVALDASGESYLYTLVPLDLDGQRRGAIELSEPAIVEHRFVRGVLVDAVIAAGALALLSALLSFVMGQWLVGGPVRLISEKARRVGTGDFTIPLALRSKDELADLARDVNTMCDRLQATVAQLRHADRLTTVGTLAAGVAHELGTPLNVVSARAEMIAAGGTSIDESRSYAKVIVGAADRMAKIIRQLLQFARRANTKKERCDLHSIAREVAELLRPIADKRSVRIIDHSAVPDATLDADPAQLQQVMINLLVNAIQAMPSGGDVTLRLDESTALPPAELAAKQGEHLRLRVSDRGEGISEQDIGHVFEPFFTTKDVGEGTGLGLAVAYGIVRDHGGWIAVASRNGEGTTFSVYLPRRAAT